MSLLRSVSTCQPCCFRVVGEDLAAVQALLLARQHAVDDRRLELVLRQHACGLDDDRRAGAVVVGARRIARRVHDVGHARIEVAGDRDDAIRVVRAALYRDNVHDLGRRRHTLARERLRRRHDLEAAAAVLADRGEVRLCPAPRRADAALVGLRVRQGMPRAEADELRDRGLELVGADRVGDLAQAGRLGGRRRIGAGRGREAEHRECKDKLRAHRYMVHAESPEVASAAPIRPACARISCAAPRRGRRCR